MATRQERMLERLRGANRHQIADDPFVIEFPSFEAPEPDDAASDDHDATDENHDTSASTAPEDSVSLAQPTPAATIVAPTTLHDNAGPHPSPHPYSQPRNRPTPNTSAKRRRPGQHDATATDETTPVASVSQARPAGRDLPTEPSPQPSYSPNKTSRPAESVHHALPQPTRLSPSVGDPSLGHRHQDDDESVDMLPTLPSRPIEPSPAQPPFNVRRSRPSPLPPAAEEVGESPAHAPGSGRRQVVLGGDGAGLNAVLQSMPKRRQAEAVLSSDAVLSSSPLERQARKESAKMAARKPPAAMAPPVVRPSPLSAATPQTNHASRRTSPRLSRGSAAPADQNGGSDKDVQMNGAQEDQDHEEAAQQIDEEEAAQRLARKRPRRSLPSISEEVESGLPGLETQAPKRRRRQNARAAAESPAQQQQPAKRPQQPGGGRRKTKPAEAAETAETDSDSDGRENRKIPITVQRFNVRRGRKRRIGQDAAGAGGGDGHDGETADASRDDSILNEEIKNTKRTDVNAIDVLSELCEMVTTSLLGKLEQQDAVDKGARRTMTMALRAMAEELRTTLLGHATELDNIYTLRQRVRETRQEKLKLRREILQIRAERDQVSLRMDGIRIRHEAERKEALRHLSLSSAMHDIDLAIEKGQAAPKLTAAEQRKAELANLELLISRISDQACGRSDGGGTLKQIKDFNAFLERTAQALEGR